MNAVTEDDFDRRAGKPPEDAHPVVDPEATDPGDYGDPRAAQPGEDPDEGEALEPIEEPER